MFCRFCTIPDTLGPLCMDGHALDARADLTSTQLKVAQSDWQVLIRGAHVGYIDWDEFERNQVTLRQSATGFGSLARGTVLAKAMDCYKGESFAGCAEIACACATRR